MKRNLRCTRNNPSMPNYCGKRFTTKSNKALDLIKCPVCNGNVMDVTKHIKMDRVKKGLCTCDGLHFKHRKGSKWCEHYKGEYTDDDYRERYGCTY